MIKYKINLKENFFSKKHINELDIFLNKLVVKLDNLNILNDIDFNIIIITSKEMKNLLDNDMKEIPKGLFNVKKKNIYLVDSNNIKEIYDTCLHEIGHLLDYQIGINMGFDTCYTKNVDISKIIKKDIEHIDYIYASIPQEFFAQSFSECFRNTYNSFFMRDTKKLFKKLLIFN
jgi:hypothetical protein